MQMQNPVATRREAKAMHPHINFREQSRGSAGLGQAWTNQIGLYTGHVESEQPTIMPLTDRERRVLQLISDGHSNKEAALSLGIAPETVKSHLKNIFKKLCVDRRITAVSRALSLGFIAASNQY
jgi:ATP/maltotriose-dependent transcriptional regulator MalT